MATLTINFTPASTPPANGYIVKYRKVGDPLYTVISPNPTASPVIVSGLISGQYEGSVQSSCGSVNGAEIPFLSNTLDCSVGIDMVFVLDTTGSMGNTIANLKASLSTYVSKVVEKSNNNYRLALVTVNEGSGGPAIIGRPLLFSANNSADLQTALSPVAASGGGAEPEPTDLALSWVLSNADNYVGAFRPGVVKIIVLMTDARPSGGDDIYGPADVTTAGTVALTAGTMGVRIFALNVGIGLGIPEVVNTMQNYATSSYGVYSESATGVVANNIITALDALCSNNAL